MVFDYPYDLEHGSDHCSSKTNRSVCRICNKKFRNNLQLEVHIKKVMMTLNLWIIMSYYILSTFIQNHENNTDLRPHKCPICPARFKVSGTLGRVTIRSTSSSSRVFTVNFTQEQFLWIFEMISVSIASRILFSWFYLEQFVEWFVI